MSATSGLGHRTADYDYVLPPNLVARYPTERRDQSRLLVASRAGHPTRHLRFSDLTDLMCDGDLLVVNESLVRPVRLVGRRPSGAPAEALLLRPFDGPGGGWEALVRPAAKLAPPRSFEVGEGLSIRVEQVLENGNRVVSLHSDLEPEAALERYGRVPLPPYLDRDAEPEDRTRYQTVYARVPGSVAAPTAGLHFTAELLERLQDRGVEMAHVVLHVGVGTFRPVEVDDPSQHPMHHEYYELPAATAEAIRATRSRGGRVWAVGTTTVRGSRDRGLPMWPRRGGRRRRGVDGPLPTARLCVSPRGRADHQLSPASFYAHDAGGRLSGLRRNHGGLRGSRTAALPVLFVRRRDGDPVSTFEHTPDDHFSFVVHETDGAARTGTFHTPHGPVETPVFMPVGTLGAVKTLSPEEVRDLGASMILANTYHLYLRPGHELVQSLGGLHAFMRWDGPILTDSGGYQVFSLANTNKVRDDEVEFQSHIDGSRHIFTPEGVVDIQRALGADVMMAFDECPKGGATRAEAALANERTARWLERCLVRFEETAVGHAPQALFPIVQGNVFADLRRASAEHILAAGSWHGVAIGGLSVGEAKPDMWRVLEGLHPLLPHSKPRYLMGVGYPDDLLEAIGRGVDMFDCVAPTRNARHGTAWTRTEGQINLKKATLRADRRPLDEDCDCAACQRYDRAYLRHLTVAGEAFAHRLISIHNLRFLVRLAEDARAQIQRGAFEDWSQDWLSRYRRGSAR